MVIVGILLVAFFIRLVGITQSFWLDEAAQMIESVRPLAQQLAIAGDFQPPLFHLLLHFWLQISHTEVWARLLPIIFGLLTVYLTYKVGVALYSRSVAVVAALFMATAPFHYYYSQEVRPYALAALLGLVSSHLLLQRKMRLYTVAIILFVYTTYLAPFLLLAQGVWLLVSHRQQFQSWVKSMVIVVLAFLPWLPAFLEQLGIGTSLTTTLPGWSEAVSTPLSKALPLTAAKFFLGHISIADDFLYAALVSSLVAFLGYGIWRLWLQDKQKTKTVLLFGAMPIISAFLFSFLLPVFAPQRLLFCLPFFYLALAAMAQNFGRLRLLIVLGLLALNLTAITSFAIGPQFQREQWRQAVQFVEVDTNGDSIAVFSFPEAFAPWLWYSRELVPVVAVAPEFRVTAQSLQTRQTLISGRERVYYFHYLSDLTDPDKLVPGFLQDLGFVNIETKDFPGVGFISIYEKILVSR